MKRKTAVLLATLGLLLTIGSAVALQWYFSTPERTTKVVDWAITMDAIDEETPRYSNITFTGQVTLGNELMPNVEVTIYLDGNPTTSTGFTDSYGRYEINYTVIQPAGTVLSFKAGVFQ